MDRSEEGLELLGKKTEYKEDYAPEVLETFSNKHLQRDYWVRAKVSNSTSSVFVRMVLFTKIVSISSWTISSS